MTGGVVCVGRGHIEKEMIPDMFVRAERSADRD